jgi:hypothetical protein
MFWTSSRTQLAQYLAQTFYMHLENAKLSMFINVAGWSSPVARQAHNLKVVGSNPAPATNSKNPPSKEGGFFVVREPGSTAAIERLQLARSRTACRASRS